MRYCFTASRSVGDESPHIIQTRLMELTDVSAIYTGGAPGGDQLIAELAITLFPDAWHGLILPESKYVDWDFVERFRQTLEGSGFLVQQTALHPLKRNLVLLDKGHRLEAFPQTEREVLRSGTWATIRAARKRQMPMTITPLRR